MGTPLNSEIPAGPFMEWIERRLDALTANDTLRLTEHEHRVPVERTLADSLGISTRILYRYRHGLRDGSRNGVRGEFPTETFSRATVEDMLDHAEVPFWEVYPDLDDAPDGEGHCRTCRDWVPSLDGLCTACGNAVLPQQPPGTRNVPSNGRRMTDEQIRAAHVLYERGYSLPALGHLLWQRHGYPSARACASSVRLGFIALGLPRRDQREATRQANTKHGLARKGKDGKNAAYLRFRRRQERDTHPCQHEGCRYRARPDSDLCGFHAPGFAEVRLHYLELAFAAQPRHEIPDDIIERARRLHHDELLPMIRVAQLLIEDTHLTGTAYLARKLIIEFRRRGWYLGPRPWLARDRELVAA